MTFFLSSYSFTCVSQNPFSSESSIPRATASCAGEEQAKTIRVEAARVGVMRCSGPQSHPTRHPVAANDLPWVESCQQSAGSGSTVRTADPTVTVRRQKLSRDARRTCLAPSKARQSYCYPSINTGCRGRGGRTHYFVREDQAVKLLRNVSDLPQLVLTEHLPNRVVRCLRKCVSQASQGGRRLD